MARRAVGTDFSVDLTGVANAIGTIEGVSAGIDSNYTVNTTVKTAWSFAAKDFDDFMDGLARAAPERYHHMYEWGMLGVPKGRLWKQKLSGRGRNREATFDFKNSIRSVPRPKNSDAPDEEFAKLSGQRYIFHAKAAVMESGLAVNITSRTGGKLFIPFRNDEGVYDLDKGFLFTDEAENYRPGGNVAGNFTTAWTGFWSTQAERIFMQKVKPKLEGSIKKIGTPKGYAGVTPRLAKKGFRSFNLQVADAAAIAEARFTEAMKEQEVRAEARREVEDEL